MAVTAAIPEAWSDAALDRARRVADPEVDALAAKVLDPAHPLPADTRLGYNHLLDLADRLLEEPELYLVPGSRLRQELDALDPALVGFFNPQPVPAWADEELLATAGRVWNAHALAIIMVLYAASLPACYLVKDGIPALYGTRKLGEQRFILQRLYETGLMLDAAMRADGLRLVADAAPDQLATALLAECQRRQPHAGWASGRAGVAPLPGNARLDRTAVAATVVGEASSVARYAWGKGVLACRKVRFLHASMRYYLTHPREAAKGAPATSGEAISRAGGQEWDAARLGEPVNQEDLAFTLLTFGHLIPEGLGRWGIVLTATERLAFWHRWRLIGHFMGVQEDLLPPDPASAAMLYQRILGRRKAPSDMGRTLTATLTGFFGEFLPRALRPHVPAMLIRSQHGADAELLLPPDRPPVWLSFAFTMVTLPAVRVANRVRRSVLRFFPVGIAWLNAVVHQAGQALIDSWRDAYDRRPFYVPDAELGWRRLAGADPAYLQRVESWRTEIFLGTAGGLGGLIACAVLLMASIPLWFIWPALAGIVDGFAYLALFFGLLMLVTLVPYWSRRRPRISHVPGGIRHPTHPLHHPQAIEHASQ